MKVVLSTEYVNVPANVSLDWNGRKLTVTGPRGTLARDFRHISVEFTRVSKTKLQADMWFANRKQKASLRTVCSHISNMIKGVQYGYKYKMRFVYAHFPINCAINDDKTKIDIRNFLGEKRLRSVEMIEGVNVDFTGQKDEIAVQGNDLEAVSRCAALIQQSTTVKAKDIRKFLDGIYVSEKTTIDTPEDE
eukprot:Clim_evm21s22 gene=Clim_evmTU21s22